MLTVIHTWTCCICGAVKSQRDLYERIEMKVREASTPEGWQWAGDHMLICPGHRIVIQDKGKD